MVDSGLELLGGGVEFDAIVETEPLPAQTRSKSLPPLHHRQRLDENPGLGRIRHQFLWSQDVGGSENLA